VFAKSSGIPLHFATALNSLSKLSGLNHFGESAPVSALEKEFGFIPQSLANEARAYLKNFFNIVSKIKHFC